MSTPHFVWRATLALALAVLCAVAAAQAARDPTRPPAEVSAAPEDAKSQPLAIQAEGLAVVVRDGVPMLVQGTRLFQQGQQLGPYRIERITETEVWLRNGRELHKIARFAGIQRRAAAPERSTP